MQLLSAPCEAGATMAILDSSRVPCLQHCPPGTPFVIPNNPGLHPPNHGSTAAQITQTLHEHNENLCQWKEYTNMHNALKKQLINAIKPIYL